MAYLMRSLSFLLLLAAACVAQQQSSQQSSQVKLEDIERDTNPKPQQGGAPPQQSQGAQFSEIQLTPQQLAAFQQQYLVQPQQYFAPQFSFPEFQGVPLTYVPAGGNQLGAGNPNVPPFQAYFVPQAPVVPVVPQGGQVPADVFRAPFGQPQFIQHPAGAQPPQGAPQQGPQGSRTVSVFPPNNSVYRTIQPSFGANLIYTNPPALPQQIIYTQPQTQQFGVNTFQQRPNKAAFSSGVKSTPATPTKSPDYSQYSAQTAAASSSAGSTTSDQQYRFSG